MRNGEVKWGWRTEVGSGVARELGPIINDNVRLSVCLLSGVCLFICLSTVYVLTLCLSMFY